MDRAGPTFATELAFFIDNQAALVAEHPGKVLVIRGEHVEGAYDDVLTAYLRASAQFAPGTFAIQPCKPGPEAYTITISPGGTAAKRAR